MSLVEDLVAKCKADPVLDKALGCFIGAAVGDAVGAYLEFKRKVTESELDAALLMPGGGCWGLASGQITDDTELAICLARGLIEGHEKSGCFDADYLAKWYTEWYMSPPFDCGATCDNAFRSCARFSGDPKGWAQTMQSRATIAMSSLSNGSVMRCTPLALYSSKLPDSKIDQIGQMGVTDSKLSHPAEPCCVAEGAYVIACSRLIRGVDSETAFRMAKDWVDKMGEVQVQDWIAIAERNEYVPCDECIGFVKIAFSHAMRHLLLKTSFKDAIADVLRGAGDTDTNAAIVGGLIGALHGLSGIPEYMVQAVLTSDHSQSKEQRPDWMHGREIPGLVDQLLKIAPSE